MLNALRSKLKLRRLKRDARRKMMNGVSAEQVFSEVTSQTDVGELLPLLDGGMFDNMERMIREYGTIEEVQLFRKARIVLERSVEESKVSIDNVKVSSDEMSLFAELEAIMIRAVNMQAQSQRKEANP